MSRIGIDHYENVYNEIVTVYQFFWEHANSDKTLSPTKSQQFNHFLSVLRACQNQSTDELSAALDTLSDFYTTFGAYTPGETYYSTICAFKDALGLDDDEFDISDSLQNAAKVFLETLGIFEVLEEHDALFAPQALLPPIQVTLAPESLALMKAGDSEDLLLRDGLIGDLNTTTSYASARSLLQQLCEKSFDSRPAQRVALQVIAAHMQLESFIVSRRLFPQQLYSLVRLMVDFSLRTEVEDDLYLIQAILTVFLSKRLSIEGLLGEGADSDAGSSVDGEVAFDLLGCIEGDVPDVDQATHSESLYPANITGLVTYGSRELVEIFFACLSDYGVDTGLLAQQLFNAVKADAVTDRDFLMRGDAWGAPSIANPVRPKKASVSLALALYAFSRSECLAHFVETLEGGACNTAYANAGFEWSPTWSLNLFSKSSTLTSRKPDFFEGVLCQEIQDFLLGDGKFGVNGLKLKFVAQLYQAAGIPLLPLSEEHDDEAMSMMAELFAQLALKTDFPFREDLQAKIQVRDFFKYALRLPFSQVNKHPKQTLQMRALIFLHLVKTCGHEVSDETMEYVPFTYQEPHAELQALGEALQAAVAEHASRVLDAGDQASSSGYATTATS